MTVTIEKTPVVTTWTPAKIQEQTALAFARQTLATMTVLRKLGPEAMKEFQHASVVSKADFYKTEGVKTPIQLVKAMAEFETSALGSKIKVWGDDKQASMEYEVCACFNAMQKSAKEPMNMEDMGKCYTTSMEAFANEFGFTAQVVMGKNPGEPSSTLTFIKK